MSSSASLKEGFARTLALGTAIHSPAWRFPSPGPGWAEFTALETLGRGGTEVRQRKLDMRIKPIPMHTDPSSIPHLPGTEAQLFNSCSVVSELYAILYAVSIASLHTTPPTTL